MSFLRRWSPSYLTCCQIKITRYCLFFYYYICTKISAVYQDFLSKMFFCVQWHNFMLTATLLVMLSFESTWNLLCKLKHHYSKALIVQWPFVLLFLSGRSLSQKHLFSIMHSSWRRWWKATSQTPCPTALYILASSSSVTRSLLGTWQKSASCWTLWSQSSSTWWTAAL